MLSWRGSVCFLAILATMPIAMILISWTSVQQDFWSHLIDTQLAQLIRNTIALVLVVATGVVILGVSLGWLTAMYHFPGRQLFVWALLLPLAMPAYVLAFIIIGIFDYAGPVQTQLRHWFGDDAFSFQVRNLFGISMVFIFALYPYVYLLARNAFLKQGRCVLETAQILGLTPRQAFFRVALPIARPAIVIGTSLALMETLADFGAVSIFNYDTFTTAIYKAWYGFFNLTAGAQLASILLIIVAVILLIERLSRGKARYDYSGKSLHEEPLKLIGWKKWAATLFCCFIISIAFFIPIIQLLVWFWQTSENSINQVFVALLNHSVILASLAVIFLVVTALLLAYTQRIDTSKTIRLFIRAATLGYALPGTVLAVGIVLVFTWIDHFIFKLVDSWLQLSTGQLLVGSVFALLLAYIIRFQAVAFGPIESSLASIQPSLNEAARSLGAKHWRAITRVFLPLLRPGILAAMLLVFIEVVKELPATLLMRPFGWDTLAVRVYEMTSEGQWQLAALPALTIVFIGLLPIILLSKKTIYPSHDK